MFAFAIETPLKPILPSAVALDQGGKLPLRLGAGRPQPLMLLERGLVSYLLQLGGTCFQRRIQPRLSCQRVDDQNEIATSAFRIGISAGEGKGQTSLQAQLLRQSRHASGCQYGMKALRIKLAVREHGF